MIMMNLVYNAYAKAYSVALFGYEKNDRVRLKAQAHELGGPSGRADKRGIVGRALRSLRQGR
jgi:hypothetical protein